MNFSTIRKANWVVATVLLATSGMLATSCSKERGAAVEQADNHEGTNIVLSIKGINEGLDNTVKQASNNSKSSKLQVESFGDVDVVSAVDNNVPFKAAASDAVQSRNADGTVAAASTGLRAAALDNGVTYRVYLFSADGTQLLSSKQYSVSGTDLTIPVTHGTTYKWVALSYNNTDAIPDITVANPTLQLPENKDVLYASGSITIPTTPGTDVSLPITFAHKYSRIAIELNTMGVFGNMVSGNLAVSNLALRSAALNVATGALTPSATTFAPTLNWASFTNIDPTYSDAKIAYVYTAGTTALNNVTVSVTNLAIKHADNVDRTFATTAPINISFNVTPVLGNSHRLLANIVESPLTSTGSTVKWSRSNLYYTAGHNPYRFFANNKQRSEANSYFAYGAILPGQFQSMAAYADPCTQVYPQGLWRKPTHADFSTTAYVSSNALLTDVLQNITDLLIGTKAPNSTPSPTTGSTTGNYIQYSTVTGTGNTAFDAASNNLRFYYNGQLARVNVLDPNFLTLDLTAIQALLGLSYGREAALWTSDPPNSILGLVNLGTWGYLAVTKQPILTGRIATAQGTAELLSTVSLLGINVASSSLKNVRCVRTN